MTCEKSEYISTKEKISPENQSNEEFNEEKFHLETGKQFNDLIAHYPVTVEELLRMSQVLCKFVECTRITDIIDYFFIDKDENIPRLPFMLKTFNLRNPIADVQEVKHGKWEHDEFDMLCCSEGKEELAFEEITPYCPYCGAKMDEEKR